MKSCGRTSKVNKKKNATQSSRKGGQVGKNAKPITRKKQGK